jgi:hypothetical protein
LCVCVFVFWGLLLKRIVSFKFPFVMAFIFKNSS